MHPHGGNSGDLFQRLKTFDGLVVPVPPWCTHAFGLSVIHGRRQDAIHWPQRDTLAIASAGLGLQHSL